jgi:alkyl sulfatase BDS1-like metallo-beta-lactamase superfamily hydrolase
MKAVGWILCGAWMSFGCVGFGGAPDDPTGRPALNPDPKPATTATRAVHERFERLLPFEDDRDFDLAEKGLLARKDPLRIPTDNEESPALAWDMTKYGFIEGGPPDSVNPSLWRQAKLNTIQGLFEVVDGIYQVRGYDLSNISFIAGKTGWIVLDPLITVEAARAALSLVNETLGERPVVAVLYSHSHADHFGGVRGVTTAEEVEAGRVRIVASEGFSHHAVSENVVAGNVMTRRAGYMFGRLLEPGPTGRVDAGLGKTTSVGRVSMIAPTDIIARTGTKLTIDGIDIFFQNTPNAEAPAEMMFYFPHRKAFYAAEEANAVLHNLYTLRGAQVRSGADWARWLDEAIDLFGDEFEVVFGGHHWPRWGREEGVEYLASQRDLYKYIHDQTLHLANLGLTPLEIADRIELPESLATRWFNRGYYGTVNHNSKATYQLYLGWFDGNPANLDPHPPVEVGKRYVELAGGADAMLSHARDAYAEGDYRWVAEMMKHLVFAEPGNDQARWLEADALEQLGYQAESGPWRNFYLTGAQELRQGELEIDAIASTNSPDVLAAMDSSMIFDFLAVSLDGEKAAEVEITLDLEFTDRSERWLLEISRGVLRYHPTRRVEAPTLSMRISRADFMAVLSGTKKMPKLLAKGDAELDGGVLGLAKFGRLFDRFSPNFEIVTP